MGSSGATFGKDGATEVMQALKKVEWGEKVAYSEACCIVWMHVMKTLWKNRSLLGIAC